MNGILERFIITDLHHIKNIDVRLNDNTLILVGENGSGKTTLLRILFHFLSGNWSALAQFQFTSIIATIDGREYEALHKDLVKPPRAVDNRIPEYVPPSARRRALLLAKRGDLERAEFELRRYNVPYELILRELGVSVDYPKNLKKNLKDTISKIHDAISAQVLYLPTYRRIERELSSIFEGVDSDDFRQHRRRLRESDPEEEAYIELVEFGMNDVQQAVERTLAQLKEFARENLNNLTLRYLGDVVEREYQNIKMKQIADVPDETVRAVLDRIDNSILSKNQKKHLSDVVDSARLNESLSEHQQIIYHYFLKLLDFQQNLRTRERRISEFCVLCSEYIVDKKFIYNSSSFDFSITPADGSQGERTIRLSDLSSGEKQIVSLFSHLYLSGYTRFFVLIDEPELSLSVPWQRRFLTDIRNGEFCRGVVAATHSPFIYDNELRCHTHSLGEFLRSQ